MWKGVIRVSCYRGLGFEEFLSLLIHQGGLSGGGGRKISQASGKHQ
jgi:hypothetical protein